MGNKSKTYRIYDKTTKQWYEISEDQYREYDRWRTALRKRMQYRGECFCPRSKWWLCDGNCLDCEFHNNTTVSLDDPLPDGEGTLADYVPDDAPLIEEVLSEKAELDRCSSVCRSSCRRPSVSESSARKASPTRPSPTSSASSARRSCPA